MSSYAERTTELHRLIVEQGQATQRMKYGWKPTAEEQQALNRTGERMHDLAELINAAPPGVPVGKYLNDRVASWLRANPLPLTMQRVLDLITPPQLYTLEGGVIVTIGELRNGGYSYRVMADDFAWSGAREEELPDGSDTVVRGDMVLRVPDSVAEHFRQQGRRALQRELANLLAVESHL